MKKALLFTIVLFTLGSARYAQALPLTITIPSSNFSYEVEGEIYIDINHPVKLLSGFDQPTTLNKTAYLDVRSMLDKVYDIPPTYNHTPAGRVNVQLSIDGFNPSIVPNGGL